jgi:hypothetical protein
MLAGKMTVSTTLSADDHRQFNREGASFDKGETFSGSPSAKHTLLDRARRR